MNEIITNLSTRNLICLPGAAATVRFRSSAAVGSPDGVEFQVVRIRSVEEDGLHVLCSRGRVIVEIDGEAVLTFAAPQEPGDYRVFFSYSGNRDRKALRLIVTSARVESGDGISILAEDSQLLAGLFWKYSRVFAKKFIRSKVFGTKILLCRATGGKIGHDSFSYIAKLSSETDVKAEFVNLKDFTEDFGDGSPSSIPSVGECVITMGKGGILYDFGTDNTFDDCYTLIDWITEKDELEIRTVIKALLGDLMGEIFYRKSSVRTIPLFEEYSDVVLGDRMFGIFNPSPSLTISCQGIPNGFEAEGEPYYGDVETHIFRGRISSVMERAILILDQSVVGKQQLILVRNLSLSREALGEFSGAAELTFTLRGAPPISLADYYSKFVVNAYSGCDVTLADTACVTALIKEISTDFSKIRISTVHGNLHPRNVLVAVDGTLLLIDFENVARESHVLKDFTRLETYIKFWGVIPAITAAASKKIGETREQASSEKAYAQAMLEFEKSLDDGGFTSASASLYPYLIAIDEIRVAAREFLYKSSEMREYYASLFLSGLFVLRHYSGNYGNRQAQLMAISAGHYAMKLRGAPAAADGRKPPSAAALACFMFVDVVNFSRGEMSEQLDLFTRMSRIAMEMLFPIKRALGGREQIVTHSTGDGFVVAFLRVPHEDVLNFAIGLSRKLAAEKIPVRSGLHYGYCYIQKNHKGEQDVVGEGPNTTQRIMAVGGAGHILCSEAFSRLFTSSPFEKCFTLLGNAVVKHDVVIKRIYNILAEGAGNASAPSSITQKSAIEKQKSPPAPDQGVLRRSSEKYDKKPEPVTPVPSAPPVAPPAAPPATPPPSQQPAKVAPKTSGVTGLTSLKRAAIETAPCLLCLTSPYTGKTFFLDEGDNVIGRSRKSNICLREVQYISGRHAVIKIDGRTASLEDCDSTNGTFVNDKKVARIEIKEGDIVAFATLKFKFLFKKHKV